MRHYLLVMTLLFSLLSQAQDFHVLRGYVFSEDNQAIPNVYVRVQNSGTGTVTNDKGQYELRLQEGLNRVAFSIIGYHSQLVDVVMQGDQVKNIWLRQDDVALEEVTVKYKKRDYSYEIIRNVIKHKDRYRNQYKTLKQQIYIKSIEEIKNRGAKNELDQTNFLDETDSVPNMNMFEGRFITHFQAPNRYKEEKIAAEKRSSQSSLFYTTTTDGKFDFYENFFKIKKLGDNTFVSPLSPTTFISYKFKLLDTYLEDGRIVYRIKLIPKSFGNALLKGELEVYDEIWALKSVKLEFPKQLLIKYDEFKVEQDFVFKDSLLVIAQQRFSWKIKTSKRIWLGHCVSKHSDFVFDTIYHRRFFGDAMGITSQDAYDKDSSYWNDIRPIPLTKDEQSYVRYKDSIYQLKNSKVYLDSIDSVFNRISLLKLTLYGFGHINRSKKTLWDFSPAINMFDPLAIGGWRIRYMLSYYKRYENRRSFRISPFINYGFLNNDLKGNLNVSLLYDPIKRSRLSLNTGRYFGFVNNFATIGDIFRRDNFYEESFGYLTHRSELFNGFYMTLGLSYVQRNDLGNFKFASFGDSLFENNRPVTFPTNTIFGTRLRFSYTPRQLYLLEPKEKIILGSKYPTFAVELSKAWPNVFKSNNQFSYFEFSTRQLFNIGTVGTSEYRITAGKYLDTTNLSIMDYRYQRGGDPYLFTPAMFTFQRIDKTFPVFDWFFEAHYVHQFNGFLTGRIPGFKQLGIRSMAGGGFLYSPEHNYQYSELYYGINRIFRIGRERLRLGAYYVAAQSNTFGFRGGIKFSIEFYNPTKNTWSF